MTEIHISRETLPNSIIGVQDHHRSFILHQLPDHPVVIVVQVLIPALFLHAVLHPVLVNFLALLAIPQLVVIRMVVLQGSNCTAFHCQEPCQMVPEHSVICPICCRWMSPTIALDKHYPRNLLVIHFVPTRSVILTYLSTHTLTHFSTHSYEQRMQR